MVQLKWGWRAVSCRGRIVEVVLREVVQGFCYLAVGGVVDLCLFVWRWIWQRLLEVEMVCAGADERGAGREHRGRRRPCQMLNPRPLEQESA